MLDTAILYFNDDVSRAVALIQHAQMQPSSVLQDDILRASWMMFVGACDAYFSDAYADLVSRSIRAKEMEPSVDMPDRLNKLKVPVTAILRQANGGWRWRMAARELMEDENVLSLEKIKQLFNHFFRRSNKILVADTLEAWITHRDAKQRMFGITATAYRKLNLSQKGKARKEAMDKLSDRFKTVFKRRHDCIHNCDRPKAALQNISIRAVEKVSDDVQFLVNRCHEALQTEFPIYLQGLGFSPITRNRVGA
ncbi:MAG: hypothetical protein JRD93_21650 [Deltaproteobacteria bacterium]|nr:hypothetical protein [Deltaproteobacteria bacterium]